MRGQQQQPYRFRASERDTHAQITLSVEGGELVVEKPTSDAVRGGNHIIWLIDNQTEEPHTVEVKNFKPKASSTIEWPFQDSQPAVMTVPAGRTKSIKLKTLDKGPLGKKGTWVYEYEVWVDDQKVDPEIVIEWPS